RRRRPRARQRLARKRAQRRQRAVERLERGRPHFDAVAQLRDRRLQVVLLRREGRDGAVQVGDEALERVFVERQRNEHLALALEQARQVVVLRAEGRLGDLCAVAIGPLPVPDRLVEAGPARALERGRELVEDDPEVLPLVTAEDVLQNLVLLCGE